MDWRDFVETTSVVERTLREDPAGVYGGWILPPAIATATPPRRSPGRPSGRGRGRPPGGRAGACGATGDAAGGAGERARHVGFYLIDKGLPELERAADSPPFRRRGAASSSGSLPLTLYLGGIVLLSAISAPACSPRRWLSACRPGGCCRSAALAAGGEPPGGGAGQLAGTTLLVAPHALPRMDFAAGIPANARTLVVVPTLLGSAGERRRSDRGAGGPLPGESR
jgi:cyclic beta-1,2-glucan synthetase